jgi:hypothetical protein
MQMLDPNFAPHISTPVTGPLPRSFLDFTQQDKEIFDIAWEAANKSRVIPTAEQIAASKAEMDARIAASNAYWAAIKAQYAAKNATCERAEKRKKAE